MNCPKCNKPTTVLITTEAKANVRERRGILRWTLLFPITFTRWLWSCAFGHKEKYYKKTYYHCNSCGHDFPEPKQD